jgi:acyl-CoA dehydrogenase
MTSASTPFSPMWEARHEALAAQARAHALKTLEPLEHAAHDDLAGASRRIVRAMGEEGLLKHVVTTPFGGAGSEVEVRSLVACREGIAYGSGLADALFALQGLGSLPISTKGTKEQQKAWLPKVASGSAVAAFAVTEPEAGSDVASMRTSAKRQGNDWVLSGTKTFISNAGIADFYTLFAKTDPSGGHKGISAFLVPADAKGITVEPMELVAPHPIGTLRLKDVHLDAEALIGAEGEGFKLALATLDRMRPTVAAAATGLARRALDVALSRAHSRQQFGQAIGEHQGLRWRLADAETDWTAARLMVHRAAWLHDLGQERTTLESAQAKLLATETAQRVIDLCVQVHGGSGLVSGSLPERLYREVRALRIYEGTTEILRDIIGRTLMRNATPPKPSA